MLNRCSSIRLLLLAGAVCTAGCDRNTGSGSSSEVTKVGAPASKASSSSAPDSPKATQTVIPRTTEGENVLLITIDTTRADRLGCYGCEKAKTPAIDSLAGRGTLFEQAYAQVPITLPSHCSILTGRYPREHGVMDNGRAKLSGTLPTLAKIAKARGYQTAAFVASYILDSRFGLDAGFDLYSDDMGTHDLSTDPTHWEQPANVVTDRALEWLETAKGDAFLAWVHYYDAHDPYAPPPDFANIGAGPYDGEIAFIDVQIARLMKWLDDQRLTERTLVVLVGDHGESFGEHGERGHTIFLYQTNVHVPLVFAHPRLVKLGQRVPAIVELVDVFPTIVELLEWESVDGLGSRSLAGALSGGEIDDRPAYSESLYVLHTYGMVEQRSLITARWKYISSTQPELYDLRADRDEKTNLVRVETQTAADMLDALRTRYSAMTVGEAEKLASDAKSRQGLAALGYTESTNTVPEEFLTPKLLDPKDNLILIEQLKTARRMMTNDQDELALPLLIALGRKLPNSMAVQSSLGSCYLRVYDSQEKKVPGSGKEVLLTRALEALEATVRLDPSNHMALVSLGDVFMRLSRFDKAIKHYQTVLENGDPHAEIFLKLADACWEARRIDDAVVNYKKALELDATLAKAHFGLGVIYADREEFNDALRHYHEAARHNPDDALTRYNLGLTLFRMEQYQAAISEFEQAVHLKENYGDAMINLGVALIKDGRVGEGQAMLMKASYVSGSEAEAFFNLAIALMKQGATRQAIGLLEKSLALKPTYDPPIDELTRLYLAQGDAANAVRVLRVGAQSLPREVRFANVLAKVLATSRDDAVRNGAESVGFAERASELTGRGHPAVLQTLAAAHAEAGDLSKAKEVAAQALSLARAARNEELVRELEAQIKGFEEGRPVRAQDF